MTTQSQPQRMDQPEPKNGGQDNGGAPARPGASDGFVGAACGAGAGAAIIWQPVTVRGDRLPR